MEMSTKKKIGLIIAALVIIGASFSFGAFFGYQHRAEIEKISFVSNKNQPNDINVDFDPFWKVWRTVEEKYGLPEKIDRQQMLYGAINGLLKPLDDPYTTFFPPVQKELFESGVRGNFEGVGMEISIKDGFLTVVAPLKGTPAYNAGIKAGDKILKIGDKDTTDLSVQDAVSLIRGPKGTSVKLTLVSEGEDKPHVLSVVRDTIQIPVLESEKIGSDVWVIHLHNFSERSAFEFQKALREFIFSNTDKLVIDLRGNPGGYLESAVDMASWFLELGKPVLREKYRDGSENVHKSKGYAAFAHIPLVVLIDGGSASASEILAGALHDNGKAKLVGEKSFGKGSVQEVVPITDDTSLKITIARWLTPNGVDITKAGIKPDFEVKISDEDLKQKKDPQMEKALEILKNWPKQ